MTEAWLPPVERQQRGGAVSEITDGWQARLILNRGKPAPLLANILIALRQAPAWSGVLAHDDSAHRTVARKSPPWKLSRDLPFAWTEVDDTLTAEWAQQHGIAINPQTAAQAVQAVAVEYGFHPIRDYLAGLKWDGDGRIDTWVNTYLGTPSGEYAAAVGARWLIGAVARVLKPGCKNDCALILEGPQGARKSTALRILGEPWFTDDLADIGSKDSQIQIRGAWIVEWGELDAMSRVDVARVKSFMARGTDRFRPPYGRRLIELPRESVFAGTTNSDAYLRDETGARRFWPVKCGSIDTDLLRRDRDQLWAEAAERFKDGAVWWLDRAELVEQARLEQEDRYEGGVWDQVIAQWITRRESVSIDEVLAGAIVKPAERWTQADKNAVGRSLRAMGWVRRKLGPRSAREYRFWSPCPRSAEDVAADVDARLF